MHTAFAVSTVRIFTIRFTGTPGTTTLIMILFITLPGTLQPGRIHGTGDGATAGIRLTAAGGILLITVTGTALTTAGDIHTTVHGIADITQATTTATITTAGMPIQITTGTEKEEPPEQMYVTMITELAAHPLLLPALMAQQPKAAEMVM